METEVQRICPVCGGVRGLRAMEGPTEKLCKSESACLQALMEEILASESKD